MELTDDDLWAIAVGVDPDGSERHFLVYAHRRGFTIRSRTRGVHTSLRELNEANVRDQIALLHRTRIEHFKYRPRRTS